MFSRPLNDLNSATLRDACRGFCRQTSAYAAVPARQSGLALAGIVLLLAGFALSASGATTPLRITSVTPRNGLVDVNWQGGTGPFQLLCRTNYITEWRKAGQPTTGYGATVVAPPGAMCFFLVTTDLTPPTVPANLGVTTNGCGTALVTWNASADSATASNAPVSGLKGYRIYRNGAFVRSVSTNTLATVVEGLSSATTYSIGVAAVDMADNESIKAVAAVTSVSCPNQRPISNPGPNQTNLMGTTTIFDGSGSRDLDGSILFYSWNFGDGTVGSEISPAHRYATSGTYTATLVVTDNLGLNGTNKAIITINQPPVAHAGPDQTNMMGATVSFDARDSRDLDGIISLCVWRFGDGASVTNSGTLASHVYTAVGTYSVTLAVRDNAGAVAKATALVTIKSNAPPVPIPGPSRSAVAKTDIVFDGSHSWDPDGTVASYIWDFGDGMNATGPTKLHAYTNAGTYLVQLTVIDNFGAAASGSAAVTVSPPPNQLPSANAGPDKAGLVGTAVTLTGSGLDPDGSFLSYNWTFGDGTSGAGATASHTYASAGSYTATLTVTDGSGGTASDTALVSISAPLNQLPVVNAGSNKTAMAGTAVTFSGSALDPDGAIVTTTWTFGDGGSSFGTNASHTYTNAGTFTATLTATDNSGGSTSSAVFVSVSTSASSGTLLSAMKLGGPVNDSGEAVAVDRNGNVIIGGTADYRPFLAKRTPSGTVAWAIELPGGGKITGVAVDGHGDIFVTGNFIGTIDFGAGPVLSAGGSYDIFIAKYSAEGAHLWSKTFGSPVVTGFATDTGYGIAVDTNDNSVVVTGVYDTSVDFGGGLLNPVGGVNLFLVKFRSDGVHGWSKRVVGANGAVPHAVAIDKTGNIFLTGEFYSPVNFGNGMVTNYGVSNSDMFVAKYSTNGGNLWVKHFGRVATQCRGHSVAVDVAGDVIIAGVTTDTNSFGGALLGGRGMEDIVLAKYSGVDGSHRWSTSFGSLYYDLPFGVAVDSAGRITITGAVRKPIDFGGGILPVVSGRNIFVANFNANGSHRWSKIYGNGSESGAAVAVTPDGRIFVTGLFSSISDFGGYPAGGADIFLAEFAP